MKFEKRNAEGDMPAPKEDKQDGNKPVVVYIMILFIVAFLLMALSFFMHQRSNTELQHSVNNMQQVQENQEKIIDLQDQLAIAKAQLQKAQDALEEEQDDRAAAEAELQKTAGAFQALYTLQQQYLTHDYAGCVKTIQDAESAGLAEALPDKEENGVTSPAVRWAELKEAVESKENK